MTVTVDVEGFLSMIEEGCIKGLAVASEQILADCNQYCLLDQGRLQGSAEPNFDGKSGTIVWNTPYAKRRYYEPTPRTRYNNNARLRWAEEAANDFSESWAAIIAKGSGIS